MHKTALYLQFPKEDEANKINDNTYNFTSDYSCNTRKRQKHLLSGMVFCGDCNSPMTFVKESPTNTYLVCSSWKKHSKLHLCASHSIREDIVINAVLTELYAIAKNISTDDLSSSCNKKYDNSKLISSLENKISDNKTALLSLYKDKCRGIVSEDDYIFMSEGLKKEILFYESQLTCFIELQQERDTSNGVKKYISDILSFEKIDKDFLSLLVNKIYIYNDKKIVIEFNFTEPQ